MSGSGSGGAYQRASRKRLQQLLRDPAVKRDPNKLATVQREIAFRRQRAEAGR